MDFILAVGNMTNAPLIISVSYGESEVGNTVSWIQRLDKEFQLV